MEINAEQLLENAIRDGIREGVKSRLSNHYGSSPMDKLIDFCINARSEEFRTLLDDSLKSCLNDIEFRETIAASVRSTLAKTLVQRFGGELEKQVNTLKSDPTTRARITLAIEEIVKQKTQVA